MDANEVNRNENKYRRRRRRRSEEDANNMDLDLDLDLVNAELDRRKECSKEKKITIQLGSVVATSLSSADEIGTSTTTPHTRADLASLLSLYTLLHNLTNNHKFYHHH
jgi:hypothetical protein